MSDGESKWCCWIYQVIKLSQLPRSTDLAPQNATRCNDVVDHHISMLHRACHVSSEIQISVLSIVSVIAILKHHQFPVTLEK